VLGRESGGWALRAALQSGSGWGGLRMYGEKVAQGVGGEWRR